MTIDRTLKTSISFIRSINLIYGLGRKSGHYHRFDKMSLKHTYHIACILMSAMTGIVFSINLPTNPSLIQSANVSSGTALNQSQPVVCTRKQDWYLPRFNRDDCNGTLLYLYIEEMYSLDWRGKWLEFLDAASAQTTKLQYQITPMKFIFRESIQTWG